MDPTERREQAPGPLARVERFFTGHGFAALVLGVVALFALGTAALLLWPAAPSGAGAFAEQFRVWCFGADPGTGATRKVMVTIAYLDFAALFALVAYLWREPLRAQWQQGKRGFAAPLAAAAAVAVAGGLGFLGLALDKPLPVDPTVFQADALRVAVPAPRLSLLDHTGQPLELAAQKGKVVLVTAVYASCGLACPRIMGQAKRAVGTLSEREREDLVVLGVTLDPEHDTVEKLSKLAAAQGIAAPLYRLLTGPVAEVNAVLDRLDVSRRKNPETGQIDHTNLFLLVDRQGRIAYRFTLDPLQEKWLGEAMKVLLAEPSLTTARR